MKQGHEKRRIMWIMEELAAHWRTAAFKHGAALMLWPWALCFFSRLLLCYSQSSIAGNCQLRRPWDGDDGWNTQKDTQHLSHRLQWATVVRWSEDNCWNTCSTLLVTCGPLSVSWSLSKACTEYDTYTHTSTHTLTHSHHSSCAFKHSRFLHAFPHTYGFFFKIFLILSLCGFFELWPN